MDRSPLSQRDGSSPRRRLALLSTSASEGAANCCVSPTTRTSRGKLASLSWFERNGRIAIEPEDAPRHRVLPSPDRADGLVLSVDGALERGGDGLAVESRSVRH
jgi:hypothetical protein